MNNKFILPITAAFVTTVALAPVSINAETWTGEFKALTNIPLDHTFKVKFNDVPSYENVEDILVFKDEESFFTQIDFDAETKSAYVTVEGLTVSTTYELQVFLTNGTKYRTTFTTSDPTLSQEKSKTEEALAKYVASSSRLPLLESVLYEETLSLIEASTTAEEEQYEVEEVDEQLALIREQLQLAIPHIVEIDKKLSEAESIAKKADFNKADVNDLFNVMLEDILNDVVYWDSAEYIETLNEDLASQLEELRLLATTNPYEDELNDIIASAQDAIEQFKAVTPYPSDINKAALVKTLNTKITAANSFLTSTTADEDAIEAFIEELETMISDAEMYISSVEQVAMLFETITEARNMLQQWTSLLPSLSVNVSNLTSVQVAMPKHLNDSFNVDKLDEAIYSWSETVDTYGYGPETLIADAYAEKLEVYIASYEQFLLSDNETALDSDQFYAFVDALSEAEQYDLSNVQEATLLLKALDTAHTTAKGKFR